MTRRTAYRIGSVALLLILLTLVGATFSPRAPKAGPPLPHAGHLVSPAKYDVLLETTTTMATTTTVQAKTVSRVLLSRPAHPPGTEAEFKAFIYAHESGNNPGSINKHSGACGLGQALPCSKMGCSLTDYQCQDGFFTRYMAARYGSWLKAYQFWISHRWW